MRYRVIFSMALLSMIGVSVPTLYAAQVISAQARLAELEASSGGRLGIAAVNTGNNQRILYRANEYFPMGCTSKVMGIAAILKKA
jgi:beta-lactamase class A